MGGLFSSKGPGSPPTPPPAPNMANSQAETDVAAQQMQAQLARGRSSTVLTGGSGLSNVGDTTSKKLLGQ